MAMAIALYCPVECNAAHTQASVRSARVREEPVCQSALSASHRHVGPLLLSRDPTVWDGAPLSLHEENWIDGHDVTLCLGHRPQQYMRGAFCERHQFNAEIPVAKRRRAFLSYSHACWATIAAACDLICRALTTSPIPMGIYSEQRLAALTTRRTKIDKLLFLSCHHLPSLTGKGSGQSGDSPTQVQNRGFQRV